VSRRAIKGDPTRDHEIGFYRTNEKVFRKLRKVRLAGFCLASAERDSARSSRVTSKGL
jgi:hypothetical protein